MDEGLGQVKFYPYKKGRQNLFLGTLKGVELVTQNRFNTGAYSLSHTESGPAKDFERMGGGGGGWGERGCEKW